MTSPSYRATSATGRELSITARTGCSPQLAEYLLRCVVIIPFHFSQIYIGISDPTSISHPTIYVAHSPYDRKLRTHRRGAPGAQEAAVDPNRLLVVVGFGERTRELRRHRRMGSGAVDELLGVAVERPALEQFKVEVAGAPKDRAGPGPS